MPRFLTPREHAVVAAAADVLIPPIDAHPGGAALGVADYVDNLLAAFTFDPPLIYAGGPFSGRNPFPDPATGTPLNNNMIQPQQLGQIYAWRIPPHPAIQQLACGVEATLKSIEERVATSIQFQNQTQGTVSVYSIDSNGQRVFNSTLAAGESFVQQTFLTHPWVVTDSSGTCLGIWLPTELPGIAVIH